MAYDDKQQIWLDSLSLLQLYVGRYDNFHILQAEVFMKNGFGPNDLDCMFMLIKIYLLTLLVGQTISRINNLASNLIRTLFKHAKTKTD